MSLNTSTVSQSIMQYKAFVKLKTEIRILGVLLRISSANPHTIVSGTLGQWLKILH
jgi:hypothetical protein